MSEIPLVNLAGTHASYYIIQRLTGAQSAGLDSSVNKIQIYHHNKYNNEILKRQWHVHQDENCQTRATISHTHTHTQKTQNKTVIKNEESLPTPVYTTANVSTSTNVTGQNSETIMKKKTKTKKYSRRQ